MSLQEDTSRVGATMLAAENHNIEGRPAGEPAATGLDAPRAEDSGAGFLDTLGTVIQLKRDETLFCDGNVADRYYKVVSGVIRSCKLLSDGRRHIEDFFLPGDFIGVETLGTHGATAEAVATRRSCATTGTSSMR